MRFISVFQRNLVHTIHVVMANKCTYSLNQGCICQFLTWGRWLGLSILGRKQSEYNHIGLALDTHWFRFVAGQCTAVRLGTEYYTIAMGSDGGNMVVQDSWRSMVSRRRK